MGEIANLETNYYERPQPPVEEQQVHAKPLVPGAQTLLPRDKNKFVAKFQQGL